MLRKLRAFYSLTRRSRQILMQAWFLLLAVDLGLRFLPYKRLQVILAKIGRINRVRRDSILDVTEIETTETMVIWASQNHLYAMTCLRKALVLQVLLAWRGLFTDVKFGVRKEAGQVLAHAWLEMDGHPVGKPGVADYYSQLNQVRS